MTLLERVTADIADAMKAKDQVTLSTLRLLKAALVNKSVEKGRDLDQAESLHVVSALVKQRRDAIELFQKGGRADLVDKETSEIAVLERLLPPPIDRAAVERAIEAAIAETGAQGTKDMGRVMKAVLASLEGRNPDGRLVSELVKQRLAR